MKKLYITKLTYQHHIANFVMLALTIKFSLFIQAIFRYTHASDRIRYSASITSADVMRCI